MATSLRQGSQDRRAVDAKETNDSLRHGQPVIIRGAHGTRLSCYAAPAGVDVGDFPKVYPQGRAKEPVLGVSICQQEEKMVTDVGPVLFTTTAGNRYRIYGHSLPSQPTSWAVSALGQDRWQCKGGEFQTLSTWEGEAEPGFKLLTVPDQIVTGKRGWIVLEITGTPGNADVAASNFIAATAKFKLVRALGFDYDYEPVGGALELGTVSATVGQCPIAWVAAAGEVRSTSVIFPAFTDSLDGGAFPFIVLNPPIYPKLFNYSLSANTAFIG